MMELSGTRVSLLEKAKCVSRVLEIVSRVLRDGENG
jgi:hypothetical protein